MTLYNPTVQFFLWETVFLFLTVYIIDDYGGDGGYDNYFLRQILTMRSWLPGNHYLEEAGIELTDICLFPKC